LLDGARQLAVVLESRLGFAVDVCVCYDYSALLKTVVQSGADLAWMPPLMHARAAAAGARLVALSQRGGVLGYRSAIVVRDGRFGSVHELSGVRAAWVDPASSSGYLFPRLHLLAAGVDPAKAFVSERFYGSATNACRAVVAGDADLGACFLSVAGDRESAQHEVAQTFKTGDALRVLDVTARIPPDGFVVSSAVDEARVALLRAALFEIHQRSDGRAALQALLQAERLVPAPDAIVRELQRLIAHAPP
jgi:phosphate/phosphite/phosphonate ABC transporter binding protein